MDNACVPFVVAMMQRLRYVCLMKWSYFSILHVPKRLSFWYHCTGPKYVEDNSAVSEDKLFMDEKEENQMLKRANEIADKLCR